MDAILHRAAPLHGTLTLPPDKAIGHRAVFAAALASGQTTIRPWSSAEDCQRTLEVIQQLGVTAHRSNTLLSVIGRGAQGLAPCDKPLHCGESGTTLRLVAGMLAGQPFTSQLIAGPSLSRRPMRRIVTPLSDMGAWFEGASSSSGREIYPPLTIHGRRPLTAIRYALPVASAQVKSAILLAGLFANGRTTVIEPHPTRDHTERTLRAFGVHLEGHQGEVAMEPAPLQSPGALCIPGDISSAAFFLVAALCVPGSHLTLEGVGLNPTRIGYLDVLRRMGAQLDVIATQDRWEPSGTVTVRAQSLRGTTVEPEDVPSVIDELPILMVAAACAEGPSVFKGIGELRVKETDRIQSMVTGLRRLGGAIRLMDPDGMEIHGGALRGSEVDSAGDHRTAMSLAVAGLVAEGSTVIRGASCVAKSYPTFFEQLQHVASDPATVKTVDKPEGVC